MGIKFNPMLGCNTLNFSADRTVHTQRLPLMQPDTFVKENSETRYMQRIEELFPNGELKQIYADMCKELGLDYYPKLVFAGDVKNNAAGGYTFSTNTISLSLEDTLGSTIKLYGVKNGEAKLQIDNKGIPVIVNKQIANILINSPRAAKNKGLDSIYGEQASDEEQKKLFLQKLYHELVHAKQHMIMRQTDGIGAKQVIQAWRHLPQDAPVPAIIINQSLENIYKKSYWANKPTPIVYSETSEIGQYAYKLLDAVQNYAPVESPEYDKNLLEIEAYQEASDYITKNYGEWS